MDASTRRSAQEAVQGRAPGPASPHSPAARLSQETRDTLGARNWDQWRALWVLLSPSTGRVGRFKAFLWKSDFLLSPSGAWKPLYHFFYIGIQIIMAYSNICMKITLSKEVLFYILVTLLFSLQNHPYLWAYSALLQSAFYMLVTIRVSTYPPITWNFIKI